MASKILQAVKTVKKEVIYEDNFLEDYHKSVLESQEVEEGIIDRYRPSSLADGCKRMIWYQRKGLGSREKQDVVLNEICSCGTDRHARIQGHIKNIPDLSWLDVEGVVEEARDSGINVEFLYWDEDHTEAKCKNHDLNFHFLCDGIFRYKKKEVILEIKTIHSFAFQKLTAPLEKHIKQATCYALSLGIDNVLFLYEDRNFMKKKLFLYEVTSGDKKEIIEKVEWLNKAIEEDKMPPKEIDKCMYCNCKGQCNLDGE